MTPLTSIVIAGTLVGAVLLWLAAGKLAESRAAAGQPDDFTDAELSEMAHPSDPLTRPLSDVELDPPALFDELRTVYPVAIDWAPPTFSQTWKLAGELHHDLGDTQSMPAVAA